MIKHTLKDGTVIEIEIGTQSGKAEAYCEAKGHKISGIPEEPKYQHPSTRDKFAKMGLLGAYALGILGLPKEKALKILAAIKIEQDKIDARPENITEKLIAQRYELVCRINGSLDDAQHAQNRSYESGEGTGQFVFAGKKHEAEAEKYREELKAFDLAHPEIIAKIKAQKAADVERHIWD